MGVAVGLATKGLNFALEAAIIKTRSDEAATTMRQDGTNVGPSLVARAVHLLLPAR
ncbi:uncharacterized protein [Physcomitrium patens]|uniref:uncharacterized protein n=1 Tax=Physcomitrium patens TaxID=3218 RepID=UPI003CCDAC25